MIDPTTQPVANRVPVRGKRRKKFGCFEWWKLRTEVTFAGCVQLLMLAADYVSDPNLTALITSHGPKYATALAMLGALRAYQLRHQDNSGKQS